MFPSLKGVFCFESILIHLMYRFPSLKGVFCLNKDAYYLGVEFMDSSPGFRPLKGVFCFELGRNHRYGR